MPNIHIQDMVVSTMTNKLKLDLKKSHCVRNDGTDVFDIKKCYRLLQI